jgi:hypothetical protein
MNNRRRLKAADVIDILEDHKKGMSLNDIIRTRNWTYGTVLRVINPAWYEGVKERKRLRAPILKASRTVNKLETVGITVGPQRQIPSDTLNAALAHALNPSEVFKNFNFLDNRPASVARVIEGLENPTNRVFPVRDSEDIPTGVYPRVYKASEALNARYTRDEVLEILGIPRKALPIGDIDIYLKINDDKKIIEFLVESYDPSAIMGRSTEDYQHYIGYRTHYWQGLDRQEQMIRILVMLFITYGFAGETPYKQALKQLGRIDAFRDIVGDELLKRVVY